MRRRAGRPLASGKRPQETATANERLVAENEALRRRLRDLEVQAMTDPLTGLLNRRAAQDAFARETARAIREDSTLCIALLDLDDFKAYNDTHGHLAGDELLRESAHTWRRAVRRGDHLARIGGDEFAVLLPRCSPPQAQTLMARLAATTSVGISWGVTEYRPGEPPDEAWTRADRALYEHKATCRRKCSRCNVSVIAPDAAASRGCPACGAPLQRAHRCEAALARQRRVRPRPAGTPRTA